MSEKQHIQPEGLFPSARMGFTQVVTSPPGRQVFVSGQVSCDERGRPVAEGDLGGQAEQACANLGRALEAAGASVADLTMLRAFIVDLSPDKAGLVAPALTKLLGSEAPPASTWVGVTGLMAPQFLIEIEAVAIVPE
jgi:enamine deaminase RidA (YjgF/YER057c/UK114 family)